MSDSAHDSHGVVYRGIQLAYNALLRNRLPRTWQVADDIAVRTGRLLDQTQNVEMEAPIRESVSNVVSSGDTVVIVGGGWGTSTVAASRAAGQGGSVIVYEAVSERITDIEETLSHNYTAAPVELVHAAVGPVSPESCEMFGAPDGSSVTPGELPDADVVVLDCEGAEDHIVPTLETDEIVVETHEWGELDPESVAGYNCEFVGHENDVATVWALSKCGGGMW